MIFFCCLHYCCEDSCSSVVSVPAFTQLGRCKRNDDYYLYYCFVDSSLSVLFVPSLRNSLVIHATRRFHSLSPRSCLLYSHARRYFCVFIRLVLALDSSIRTFVGISSFVYSWTSVHLRCKT